MERPPDVERDGLDWSTWRDVGAGRGICQRQLHLETDAHHEVLKGDAVGTIP